MTRAAASGDGYALERLQPTADEAATLNLLTVAAERNNLSALQWLANRGATQQQIHSAHTAAITHDNLEAEMCLARQAGADEDLRNLTVRRIWDSADAAPEGIPQGTWAAPAHRGIAFRSAALAGNLTGIRWMERNEWLTPELVAETTEMSRMTALELAAMRSHIKVCEWLAQRGYATARACWGYKGEGLRMTDYGECLNAGGWWLLKRGALHAAAGRPDETEEQRTWREEWVQEVRRQWEEAMKAAILATVVAGRRRRLRLPSELWEQVIWPQI